MEGANEDLFSGCYDRDAQLAKSATYRGANVNEESDFAIGLRPLMVAAEQDELPMVRLLLKNGADPQARDGEGKTAADRTRDKKILELLGKFQSR